MKFTQLFSASVMAVLIAHCWALSNGTNDSSTALQPDYDTKVEGVAEPPGVLAGSCKNGGVKLDTDVGKCDPNDSKGFLSAHNCKNKGGKYYYCVTTSGEEGTCTAIRNAVGLENGECFV